MFTGWIFDFLKLIAGDLKPGEMYTEKYLAKSFNISRTPVREALLELSVKVLRLMGPRHRARLGMACSSTMNKQCMWPWAATTQTGIWKKRMLGRSLELAYDVEPLSYMQLEGQS